MFERKLIRHPYGHEEVLIVDGAVLRAHDLPESGMQWFQIVQIVQRWTMEELKEAFSGRVRYVYPPTIRIPMRVSRA